LSGLAYCKPAWRTENERLQSPLDSDLIISYLEIKAALELKQNNPEATQTITTLLHFLRVVQGQAFSQHMLRMGLDGLHRLLEEAAAAGRFSDKEWSEWRTLLDPINPIESLRNSYIIERAWGLEKFYWPNDQLYQNFGRMFGSFEPVFRANLAVRRFIGQDQAEILEYLDEMEFAIGTCQEDFSPQRFGRRKKLRSSASVLSSSLIGQFLAPATESLQKGTMMRLAHQRVLANAINVEIFRRQHNGEIPRTLQGIGTAKLIDPFDHQPLRYKPETNGYVIYSVGEDLKDNNGEIPKGRYRDIVFRAAPGSMNSP
jgi:hypothetical protein